MLLLLLPSMLSDPGSSSFQTELLTMGCTLFYINTNLKQKFQEVTRDLIILVYWFTDFQPRPLFSSLINNVFSTSLVLILLAQDLLSPRQALEDPSLECLNGTRENTYKNCHFRYLQKRQKPIILSEVHLSVNSLDHPKSFQWVFQCLTIKYDQTATYQKLRKALSTK